MVYRQFYSIKFLCDEHRGQSAVILLQKYTAGNNYHLWFMNGGACKMGKMIAPRLFSYTFSLDYSLVDTWQPQQIKRKQNR